ncbi:MAG: ABC transporter permease [Sphingobacteriales bacterium]|nr:MAG: ABC transporter permease [Sphingobacteriales bacterium]
MKTAIIIKREYLSRVKKRSFIITTLLLPILFIVFLFGTSYLAAKSTREKKVVVKDDSGYFTGKLKSSKTVLYTYSQEPIEGLKERLYNDSFTALIHIPAFSLDQKQKFQIYSNENLGTEVENNLNEQANDIVRGERIKIAGIDEQKYKDASSDMVSFDNIVGKEQKKGNTSLASMIGMASGFLLYLFMLLYGASVMTSVMEEKTNRIAEIIVSSVKPFQLMMGKIVGVAMVGLTQVAIWVAFIAILGMVAMPLLGNMQMDPEQAKAISEQAMAGGDAGFAGKIATLMATGTLEGVNLLSIFGWFIFFFLGGYFLYAALFAAVGSLVNEGQQDAQQFSTIITLPIIFSFVIMTTAIKDPNSGLAVFGSIFPLTSPIVMMARIPFDVPASQLIISVVCLIGGFIFTTFLAAKIYRTGILMYGKKITMKEVGKWLFRKG